MRGIRLLFGLTAVVHVFHGILLWNPIVKRGITPSLGCRGGNGIFSPIYYKAKSVLLEGTIAFHYVKSFSGSLDPRRRELHPRVVYLGTSVFGVVRYSPQPLSTFLFTACAHEHGVTRVPSSK